MGVKIEFLSVWNRNFDTIGALLSRNRRSMIDDRPVPPIYPPFYNAMYIYTYIRILHTSNARARLFTASVRERKSSFPAHQYRLHRYLATLVFSARSKSLFGRGSPLLLPPIVFPPPPSSTPTFQRCVASQLHEETDAWRRRCQTWNRACAACAARATIWKLSRHPLLCPRLRLSNAICHHVSTELRLFLFTKKIYNCLLRLYKIH